ncbi:hypothetical protein H6G45_18430 [Synechocystis sp. FACHB-383]|uniref:hypothetical protein n=1 Tax=Synechocystis sp. FACHB-383 TaxID=2692864 RepID=UPI001681EBB1|nr:hypothetical protein [Synechocystis sp. FACHB-383]MBD2655418.1 hypothetical protein [Synechocystis sp. FACHB-383]
MTVINSRYKWNDTKVDVVEGLSYSYEANGTWKDWTIKCDANGYFRFYLALFCFLKRTRSARWFQLVASIDKQSTHTIVLGISGHFVAPTTGRLWAYANDAPCAYGNNTGSIDLIIKPIKNGNLIG